MKIDETIEVDGIYVRVTGEFYPGDPGRNTGPWEDCYPAEPATIDMDKLILTLPTIVGDDVEIDGWVLPPSLMREGWIEWVEDKVLARVLSARHDNPREIEADVLRDRMIDDALTGDGRS